MGTIQIIVYLALGLIAAWVAVKWSGKNVSGVKLPGNIGSGIKSGFKKAYSSIKTGFGKLKPKGELGKWIIGGIVIIAVVALICFRPSNDTSNKKKLVTVSEKHPDADLPKDVLALKKELQKRFKHVVVLYPGEKSQKEDISRNTINYEGSIGTTVRDDTGDSYVIQANMRHDVRTGAHYQWFENHTDFIQIIGYTLSEKR